MNSLQLRFWLPTIGWQLLIAFSTAAAAEKDVARLLSHAPSNTCLAVFAEQTAQAAAAFEKTSLGKAFTSSEFLPLIAQLQNANQASALELRPAFGMDWRDVSGLDAPGALLVVPLPDHSLGEAILFARPVSDARMKSLVEGARKAFLDEGRIFTEQTRGPARLWIFAPPRARRNEPARVLLMTADYCGVATSQATADAVLAVTQRTSLASDPDFRASQTHDFRASQTIVKSVDPTATSGATIRLFVRPFELWDAARQGRPLAKAQSADKDPIASARRLGYDGIKAAGLTINADSQNADAWSIDAHVLAPRPFRKALRLVSLEPGVLPPLPDWLGEDLTGAWRFRMDFSATLAGYGNVYDEANQPGPDGEGLFDDVINGLRDDPEGVRVDLRKDLFQLLGPEAIAVDQDGSRLYSIAVRNQARAIAALTRFYQGDKRVTHERIAGRDLWTVGPGASLFVEGQSSSTLSLRAIALGGDQMLLSVSPELLRTALQPDKKLARAVDDPNWKRLSEVLEKQSGPQVAARGLLRLDRLLEPSYNRATKPRKVLADDSGDDDLLTTLWRRILFGASDFPPNLPAPKIPEFDRLRPAFPRSGVNVSVADDGFLVHLIALPKSD